MTLYQSINGARHVKVLNLPDSDQLIGFINNNKAHVWLISYIDEYSGDTHTPLDLNVTIDGYPSTFLSNLLKEHQHNIINERK